MSVDVVISMWSFTAYTHTYIQSPQIYCCDLQTAATTSNRILLPPLSDLLRKIQKRNRNYEIINSVRFFFSLQHKAEHIQYFAVLGCVVLCVMSVFFLHLHLIYLRMSHSYFTINIRFTIIIIINSPVAVTALFHFAIVFLVYLYIYILYIFFIK